MADESKTMSTVIGGLYGMSFKSQRMEKPCERCGNILRSHACVEITGQPEVELHDEDYVDNSPDPVYQCNTLAGIECHASSSDSTVIFGPAWSIHNSRNNVFIGNGNVPAGKKLVFKNLRNKIVISRPDDILFLKYTNGVPSLQRYDGIVQRMQMLESRVELLQYNVNLLLEDQTRKRRVTNTSDDIEDDYRPDTPIPKRVRTSNDD